MATPRVFVASTCYDLKYIRANLKYFIKSLGYEPVLSEEGSIFYDPTGHTHDACLNEVPNCQLFVLIIGGRYGGRYKDSDKSITNMEYETAITKKIPCFILIEDPVYSQHHVYLKNLKNPEVDADKVVYPAVDSVKVFRFIDDVRKAHTNNAIQSFRDFSDIEGYLKQQWAGMLNSFLINRNEQERISETLEQLEIMNSRIEMLSQEILKSVGTDDSKLSAMLYDKMLASESMRDLTGLKLKPTPASVLTAGTLRECAKNLGLEIKVDEIDEFSVCSDGTFSRPKFDSSSADYKKLRNQLKEALSKNGHTPESYLAKTGSNKPWEATGDDAPA